jgi:hypothetical protein
MKVCEQLGQGSGFVFICDLFNDAAYAVRTAVVFRAEIGWFVNNELG